MNIRPNREDHQAMAADLFAAFEYLEKNETKVRRHYGRSSGQYQSLFQSLAALKEARALLSDAYQAENGRPWDARSIYYPQD